MKKKSCVAVYVIALSLLSVCGRPVRGQGIGAKDHYLSMIAVLPDSVKQFLAGRAEQALTYDWPSLPATVYLEYKRTGNRTGYERRQTERREQLSRLVIGELVTGDKRYLPQIVNGLWATLEESTWEIPAIIGLQKAGNGLPDPDEQIIGLVSAETGLMVATIQYMLHDQLEAFSPMLTKRINYELHKRILDPYLQRDDLWWMGFRGQAVNNWNAWINTNVFQTALLTETDTAVLGRLEAKVFRSVGFFIRQYPADGGCDEGPAYWSLAGGKLVRLLYLSRRLSLRAVDPSYDSLLHNMGTYILKMHVAGDYFVNFADAGAHTIPDPVSVYRFGDLFGDEALRGFAAYLFSLKQAIPPDSSVIGFLETAELYGKLTHSVKDPGLPACSFLPDLQVYTARSIAGNSAGLFLAVQGGNNGESHNHNDVGNFVVYADGKPVIIDAGAGTYTGQTFSSRRYELWNMQSQWHNCPLINGVMQSEGRSYHAKDVSATAKKDVVEIKMDLSGAYPAAAHVQSWKRAFSFERGANALRLSDSYLLESRSGETRINFLTLCTTKEIKKGEIGFYDTTGRQVLLLKYPPAMLTWGVEEKIMDDEKLIKAWGKKLYRLSFLLQAGAALKGKMDFQILTTW
jgi:hypothetical protein